jgi:hypothetical protein
MEPVFCFGAFLFLGAKIFHSSFCVSSVSVMVQIGDALRCQCGRVSLIILLMIYHNRIRDRTHLLCQALVQPNEPPLLV